MHVPHSHHLLMDTSVVQFPATVNRTAINRDEPVSLWWDVPSFRSIPTIEISALFKILVLVRGMCVCGMGWSGVGICKGEHGSYAGAMYAMYVLKCWDISPAPTFNFKGNFHSDVPYVCPRLHAHQQWTLATLPGSHSDCGEEGLRIVLICTPLKTRDVEHMLKSLLVICVSSLENCLSFPLANRVLHDFFERFLQSHLKNQI